MSKETQKVKKSIRLIMPDKDIWLGQPKKHVPEIANVHDKYRTLATRELTAGCLVFLDLFQYFGMKRNLSNENKLHLIQTVLPAYIARFYGENSKLRSRAMNEALVDVDKGITLGLREILFSGESHSISKYDDGKFRCEYTYTHPDGRKLEIVCSSLEACRQVREEWLYEHGILKKQ